MWLDELIARIDPLDEQAACGARLRQQQLTKPEGSLGRLEELSIQVAGIMRRPQPLIEHKVVLTMAGDHGVAAEGVSAFPQSVTAQMVENFLAGGAAVNVLARQAGARVVVVDMGVASPVSESAGLVRRSQGRGTANMTEGPAMTQQQALAALRAGAEIVERELDRGVDIVALGEMGIGNTTSAAALAAALLDLPAAKLVGRGTGVDTAGLERKIAAVERARIANRPDRTQPLDVLACFGGFEIAGLVGAALAAAAYHRPVVLDGFPSTAAGMVAAALAPSVRPYLIASHRSQEHGHQQMLDWLGLQPLLDLRLRLGEGTGAILAMMLIEAACRVLTEMATFDEAAVSNREAR
jgi:nicotinate-nucleotide--dimethylbenzimidazole phosphoribosyltransferase